MFGEELDLATDVQPGRSCRLRRGKATARDRAHVAAAVLLFVAALALRWLFWQATPDAAWPYSACYKGDAPVWLAYAEALHDGRTFELGLPLRPPGAAYLIAALWDGRPSGVATLRFLWCLQVALTVLLIYGAALRSFGFRVALMAGLVAAGSTALLILSTSLNNETPYLVLVAATFYLWPRLRDRPRAGSAVLWGALGALACLVRVEHALFFALATAALGLGWLRGGEGRRLPARRRGDLGHLAAGLVAFILVLAPWHLQAWDGIRRFNSEPPPVVAATEAVQSRLEEILAGLTWCPQAVARRQRLPAFIRRTAGNFVAATVLVRGGTEVTAEDFRILEEAFDTLPRPVTAHPFVTVYGGLNFYLANNPRASGGFSRATLEDPPPLAGGAARYPQPLVRGLPPPHLALTYPPHLEILNHGYSLAWRWIRGHPRDYLELAARKLGIFWGGAALGLSGYNLPSGLAGVRRNVDLVVPAGGLAWTAWRLGMLAAVLLGLYAGLSHPSARDLLPWLLFLATKVVVTLAFFGYARQGATVVPVVALLLALAARHYVPGLAPVEVHLGGVEGKAAKRSFLRAAVVAAAVLVAVEGVRFVSPPVLELDGRTVGARDPWPPDEHRDRSLEVE